jgi:hypothetical protein
MRRTYLLTTVCFLAFVFALHSLGNGTTFVEKTEDPFSFDQSLAQTDFERYQKVLSLTQSPFLAQEESPVVQPEEVDIYGFKGKSLKRAFAYSLIIPGSGQLYAGSKIKAALFFGLDVALWALYFNYHGKGKDKETEYRLHADQHWSEDEYVQWLIDEHGITSDTQCWTEGNQEVCFSHHLPETKTDQYYEMIGKYEQFSHGWVDYDTLKSFSVFRDVYLNMRRESNDLLNKATYSAMISLGNHILSAFDAAIAVKKYNKKGERFSQLRFKMRLVQGDREVIPRISMSMQF